LIYGIFNVLKPQYSCYVNTIYLVYDIIKQVTQKDHATQLFKLVCQRLPADSNLWPEEDIDPVTAPLISRCHSNTRDIFSGFIKT